jgi:parvulin-like peptidyl-prolyl isomerase
MLMLSGCTRSNKNVLAVIGDRRITVDDFTDRYKPLLMNPGLQDNEQVRREILEKMIDEELLITEAMRRGHLRSAEGRSEKERLKLQELLDAVLEKKVFRKLTIEDAELVELYRRLHTRVSARHLYADSRKKADSLYTELKKGKTFEELAKAVFQDPRLRDTGGDLGTFSVDEMDPAFEEAAFTLEPGIISEPVRTAQGYNILRVERRVTSPMLIESDFEKHRAKLEQYVLYREKKTAARLFADSLRKALDVTFNGKTVRDMLKIIQKERTKSPLTESGSLWPGEENPLLREELVRSKIGVWNVRDFGEHARFSSEVQQDWIRNEETLEDFIAGLVVREELKREAVALGLDRGRDLERRVQKKMDDYLLRKMEKTISDMTPVPEDSLRAYFEKNRTLFSFPPRIRLSGIVLNDASRAGTVETLLKGKADFKEVFKKYSEEKQDIGANGDIGFFTANELGAYKDPLFRLKEGQWTGPLKIGSQYHFFKCTSRLPGRLQNFGEASPQIKNILKPLRQKEAEKYILERIRQDIHIVTYFEKLKSIRLDKTG